MKADTTISNGVIVSRVAKRGWWPPMLVACAAVVVTLVLPATTQADDTTYDWAGSTTFVVGTTYDWSTTSNWDPSTGYPNAVGDVADLSGIPFNVSEATYLNPAIVSLPGPITVGEIKIGAEDNIGTPSNLRSGFEFNGGSLIMDASSGNAKITMPAKKSSYKINCDIQLNDNLDVYCNSSALGEAFLTINGDISESGSGKTLTKTGNEDLFLGGTNTYSGNTTVTNGTLTLSDGGSLLMDINDGSGTQIIRTGGTLNLNGRLNLDVDDAGSGRSWNLVVGGATYDSTFSISMNGASETFTESADVWTYSANGVWTFTEATGELVFTPPAGTVISIQ